MSLYHSGYVGASYGEGSPFLADMKKQVQEFPKDFIAQQAAKLCLTAWVFGQKAKKALGGTGSQVNIADLEIAIEKVKSLGGWWGKKHASGDKYLYQKDKNKEWAMTFSTVMKVYIEAAGTVGQSATISEARTELAQDLAIRSGVSIMAVGVAIGAFLLLSKSK